MYKNVGRPPCPSPTPLGLFPVKLHFLIDSLEMNIVHIDMFTSK
jgi:hypothetical protein